MTKFIFILGRQPALARAEIKTVLPRMKILTANDDYLIGSELNLEPEITLKHLGGTIKIGRVISRQTNQEAIISEIIRQPRVSRINFGLSDYGGHAGRLGIQIKRALKKQGINSRLVTSREKTLSSVIVTKNKCLEFLIFKNYLGVTLAVQDFKDYGERDFGRPAADPKTGMLPPKLAKIMINLAAINFDEPLLDPFCGSGTILTEAAALGFKRLIGADISETAVEATKKNLIWLMERLKENRTDFIPPKTEIFPSSVKIISKKIPAASIAAIVSEPDLGPALRGREKPAAIKAVAADLADLYLTAFQEFKKILRPAGRVVIIFPQWHLGREIFDLKITAPIERFGFQRQDQNDLFYHRPNQKVWRQILIFQI